MRKGKVNFLWDVGSGVGRVEYPDLVINDGNWHRIEASRIGLNGSVSVHALEGPKTGILPTLRSAKSPETYTVLDVDQNAYLFVGGMLGSVKADAVKTTAFSGCMGEASLDGKPSGLWNYRERDGDCAGCVVSPQPADTEGTIQFDGEGYAAVSRPTRWNPNVSTVMFKFRTFSTDALMMYFATKDMKDFMSAELSDGRVKVSYDLGSGTGSIISDKRYNDGKWKSFTMSRMKKEANIAIVNIDTNEDEQLRMASPGGATGLNLREDERMYFGGVPKTGNYRSEVVLKRFSGCMKDIEVSRTPYNLLSSPDYTGLTKGCSIEVQQHNTFLPLLLSLFTKKPAHRELPQARVHVGSEISLSFSTKSENGIILFGRGGLTSMTQLTQGLTPVHIPRRSRRQTGEVLTHTSHSHSVMRLLKSAVCCPVAFENAEIGQCPDLAPPQTPEEEEEEEEALRPTEAARPPPPASTVRPSQCIVGRESCVITVKADILDVVGMLYVGGLPLNYTSKRIGPVLYSIDACMRNFKMMHLPLDMEKPASSYRVGSCFANPEKGTYFDGTGYAKAVDTYRVGNDVSVGLEFRTAQSSGVLFGISSQKMDGLGIELVNGKLLFHADNGVGRFTAVYEPDPEAGLCDGQWHTVSTHKLKHRLELVVDGKKSDAASLDARSASADTNDPVYVGGYPEGLKQFGLTINTPFKGCMRNVKITKAGKTLEVQMNKVLELKGVQPLTCPAG
uniref:Laminin G domain-containing protein n=1 Tax=Sinocyclocheilus grahami TaxID=75366 RepID=A0A672R5T7_SINGR